MKKSCFMHFIPKGPSFKNNLDQPEVPPIKINDFEIKEVDNTKFLINFRDYLILPFLYSCQKVKMLHWAAKSY